jgi:hypothetical protein
VEVVVLGGVGIFIRSGHGVDLYFYLSTSEPPDGWWKVWFFFRNDADALLPMFMGNCPVPQPNWGTEWSGRTSTCYNPCVRSSNG